MHLRLPGSTLDIGDAVFRQANDDDLATGDTVEVQTNSSGALTLSSVPAGRYVLTVFEAASPADLDYFLAVMAYFAEHGIPSAHPVADLRGRYLGELVGKPGAVAVAVHRLRQRYGDLLRGAVAETLADPTPAAVEEELRHLMAAL